MEENNSRQNEESREELLEELQKLRSEVKWLNDKMAHMEGVIHGELPGESAQDGKPDSEPSERPAHGQSPSGQYSHDQSLYRQSHYE